MKEKGTLVVRPAQIDSVHPQPSPLERLGTDVWQIGVVAADISDFLIEGNELEVDWLPNPSSREFLADPFGYDGGDDRRILCERFNLVNGRGEIVEVPLDSTGLGEPRPILSDETHFSYPFLVTVDGTRYLVPESWQSNSVDLYTLSSEGKAQRATSLVGNFPGLDATIVRVDESWWMFATTASEGATGGSLYLFHAHDLLGPWKPHVRNPVKYDPSTARSAGTPFWHDGSLYRPTQDCSTNYGSRIIITRINVLDSKSFDEVPVTSVSPLHGPLIDGVHTLSSLNRGASLVDGRKRLIRPSALIGRVRRRCRRNRLRCS